MTAWLHAEGTTDRLIEEMDGQIADLTRALERLADAAAATDFDPDSDLCQAIMEATEVLDRAGVQSHAPKPQEEGK